MMVQLNGCTKIKMDIMHLHDLSHFTKKDDYDTPTRLFVGGDHKNIEARGKTS